MGVKKITLTPKPERRSDNPTYMSSRHVEYLIKKDDAGFWKIVMYGGGYTPKPLRGRYTKHSLAENDLIRWLKKTDKFREAIYPGCAASRRNFIERS